MRKALILLGFFLFTRHAWAQLPIQWAVYAMEIHNKTAPHSTLYGAIRKKSIEIEAQVLFLDEEKRTKQHKALRDAYDAKISKLAKAKLGADPFCLSSKNLPPISIMEHPGFPITELDVEKELKTVVKNSEKTKILHNIYNAALGGNIYLGFEKCFHCDSGSIPPIAENIYWAPLIGAQKDQETLFTLASEETYTLSALLEAYPAIVPRVPSVKWWVSKNRTYRPLIRSRRKLLLDLLKESSVLKKIWESTNEDDFRDYRDLFAVFNDFSKRKPNTFYLFKRFAPKPASDRQINLRGWFPFYKHLVTKVFEKTYPKQKSNPFLDYLKGKHLYPSVYTEFSRDNFAVETTAVLSKMYCKAAKDEKPLFVIVSKPRIPRLFKLVKEFTQGKVTLLYTPKKPIKEDKNIIGMDSFHQKFRRE